MNVSKHIIPNYLPNYSNFDSPTQIQQVNEYIKHNDLDPLVGIMRILTIICNYQCLWRIYWEIQPGLLSKRKPEGFTLGKDWIIDKFSKIIWI